MKKDSSNRSGVSSPPAATKKAAAAKKAPAAKPSAPTARANEPAPDPFRFFVERMQEGAVTVAADAVILYCNQKFADLLMLPMDRVVGSKLFSHLDPGAWQAMAAIFGGGKDAIRHECDLRRADQTRLPAGLTASRLSLSGKNVMCLLVTDLSEQKKHESVRLAKAMAERANLAKDDFLATLSHELRIPLTPVVMTATALEQDTSLPASVRESLRLIRRNVELEARLVDDLLDMTRIVKGKLELHVKQYDLHQLIHRALEICESEFNLKTHPITLNLDARQHQAEGDPARMQQAIWNLIRNAAKFSNPNGAIIIRTSNPSPGNISVEIQDSGAGFEPAFAERLFQPFEQGGRQANRRLGGLGLGLAITRSILEAHRGRIAALSEGPGKGAKFTLTVPLQHGRPPAPTKPADLAGDRALSQKRILLVEDHHDTRTSLEFLLKRVHPDVKSASTAKEARRLAAKHVFDLVISDIGLPDQSGLELMQELKDRYQLKGICLSGYGMDEDISKGEAAGFVKYLTKPVRFEELKKAISQIEW